MTLGPTSDFSKRTPTSDSTNRFAPGSLALERFRIHAAAERVAAAARDPRRILVDLRLGERRLECAKRVDHLLVFAEIHVAIVRRDVNENRDFQVLYVEDRRPLEIDVDAIAILVRSAIMLERKSLNSLLGRIVALRNPARDPRDGRRDSSPERSPRRP